MGGNFSHVASRRSCITHMIICPDTLINLAFDHVEVLFEERETIKVVTFLCLNEQNLFKCVLTFSIIFHLNSKSSTFPDDLGMVL